jgi:AcrR family transcriptional regulator
MEGDNAVMPRRPPGPAASSIWLRPAPARRQPPPAFSREEITRAAIDLADRGGLQAVSMRRIAVRIGSAPTSLYWYVSDKNELYELMADAVIGEIELPGRPSGDWRADLASIAWATLATGRRHPWFAQLGIHPVPGPQTIRYAQAATRSLESLGLEEAAEINILAALNNYIYGFLQREMAWRQLTSRTGPATAGSATSLAGRAPQGGRALTATSLAARTRLAGEESFAFGLNLLLDGIAALVAQAGE